MTDESRQLEEYQRESYEEEKRLEAYRLYCAEIEYRGEMTKHIPLERLQEMCDVEERKQRIKQRGE